MTRPHDRQLRVGHMIGSLEIGGAERQVVNLINELPATQAAIVILSKTAGPLAAHLQPGIQKVHCAARWRTLPIDVWRLSRRLRVLNLDVLQTHMFWANFVGMVAGRIAGIPVLVTTEHGRNERKPFWARWVERVLISKIADMRICVSNDIRHLRNTTDGIPAEKLCVIANGTPIGTRKRLADSSPIVIGTLGRLIEAKDFSTLINAAGLLREEGVNFRLIIVGDGPLHAQLAAQIETQRLNDVVELPGFSTDTKACLERFDLYVISSVREGQPLSLLEAMAVGLPVVATRVGGIPGTVTDGVEAVLVPPGDAKALAMALAELAGDLAFRQSLGAAAHERLLNEFSVTSSLQSHLDVYASILGNRVHG